MSVKKTYLEEEKKFRPFKLEIEVRNEDELKYFYLKHVCSDIKTLNSDSFGIYGKDVPRPKKLADDLDDVLYQELINLLK